MRGTHGTPGIPTLKQMGHTACRADTDTLLCASDNDLSFLCVTEPFFDAPEVLKHSGVPYHDGCC